MIWQLILLASMFSFGLSLLLIFKLKLSLTEKIGLSFPIGSFLVTFVWFLLSWQLDIPINDFLGFITIAVTLFIISSQLMPLWLQGRLRISAMRYPNKLETTIIAIIGFFVLATLFSNIARPIHDWDALTLYDFRAQVVSHSGSVAEQIIAQPYFLGYPFYTTLGHVSAYMFGSHDAKIWYSLIYASLIVTFYGLLARNLNSKVAAIGALVLAVQPALFGHAHVAYTNLSFALYYGLAVLYLFKWFENSESKDLIICAVLLAGSAWVRFAEPFHFVIIASIILSMFVLRTRWIGLITMFPVIIVRKVWELYRADALNTSVATTTDQISSRSSMMQDIVFGSTDFSGLVEVGTYLYDSVLKQYLYFYPLLLLALFIGIQNKNYRYVFLFVILIGHIAFLFLGTLYFSLNVEYWKEIPDSLTRMSMILIPIIYYLVFRSLGIKKNAKSAS